MAAANRKSERNETHAWRTGTFKEGLQHKGGTPGCVCYCLAPLQRAGEVLYGRALMSAFEGLGDAPATRALSFLDVRDVSGGLLGLSSLQRAVWG